MPSRSCGLCCEIEPDFKCSGCSKDFHSSCFIEPLAADQLHLCPYCHAKKSKRSPTEQVSLSRVSSSPTFPLLTGGAAISPAAVPLQLFQHSLDDLETGEVPLVLPYSSESSAGLQSLPDGIIVDPAALASGLLVPLYPQLPQQVYCLYKGKVLVGEVIATLMSGEIPSFKIDMHIKMTTKTSKRAFAEKCAKNRAILLLLPR